MAEPIIQEKDITPAPAPEPAPERTFTQAEMDSIIGKRLAKAMKGMPGEEELTAFRAWKQSQQTENEKMDALQRERDESAAALTAAQAELEQYKREKYLLSKGVNGEDVDYYAFKIGKLVSDELTFEKAAEQYLKEHPAAGGMRVDTAAPLSGGKPGLTPNEQMNSLIRGARQ